MTPSYGGSSSRTSSTTTPTTASSSLRPRVGRLISGLDDEAPSSSDWGATPTSTSASASAFAPAPAPAPGPTLAPALFQSRDPSPFSSRHPSRPTSSGTLQQSSSARLGDSRREPPSLSLFFTDSWNALQGKASELLGANASTPATRHAHHTRRKPSYGGSGRTASAPPQWGPPAAAAAAAAAASNSIAIGVGSQEGQARNRRDEVRALKRRDLLVAAAAADEYTDAMGRFKRRSSEDRPSASAPPGDNNEPRDALVYLHHVQPHDTLAGISIRYNCKEPVVRRANRMWPNDRVQVRKTIILPVDACAVKGRPIGNPEDVDLLLTADSESQANNPFPTSSAPEVQPPMASTTAAAAAAAAATTTTTTAITTRSRNESISTASERPSSSGRSTIETEPQWVHDSWVLLPNSKEPTEIARLSRRHLGYFPPARRKSQSFSDLDTPSTSLDLARMSTLDHPVLSPPRHNLPRRPGGSRKLSNACNGYFPSYLTGPGGVGTMGKNVKSPGPAQDGLNKLFAGHLPNVAPPPNQQNLYLPDIPVYCDNPDSVSSAYASGTHTPNTLGLENMGGAIETWAKKMAAKARTALEAPDKKSAARASVGMPGRGGHGIGDLIEMADQFDIGDADEEQTEDEERGRRGSANLPTTNGRAISHSTSYGHDTLRERARGATSAGAGSRRKDD